MGDRKDVWQGTLGLIILKIREILRVLHGYRISGPVKQTRGRLLSVNYGTISPVFLKLEREGFVVPEWGLSDSNRKASYCKLGRAGRKQLGMEAREWQQTNFIPGRFLCSREPRP